jgi:hypothetical protein
VSGDTVSFSTNDHKSIVLFFSPDAVAALSPKPANPLSIAAGGKAVFKFSSSNPGAYSLFFGATLKSGPANFPTGISRNLILEISAVDVVPSFGSPHDTTSPGS